MVQPISQTLLSQIASPPTNPIPAALGKLPDRRRKNLTRKLVGEILSKTMGGKLGALGKINPAAMLELSKALGIPVSEKERIQSMIGDIQIGASIFESAGPEAAAKFAAEKASMLAEMGIRPTQYLETIQGLTSKDPAEVQAAGEALIALRNGFISDGILKSPDASKNVSEIRKETRARISKQLDLVRQDAKRVEENFSKVKNLVANIKTGNRIASAQAIIALVKIGDDSTVREGELKTALANVTPQAAVFDFLVGEGVASDVARSVSISFDPLNPDTMKVQDILDTADSLVLAQVPSIQSSFAESQELGETNLTIRGFKSVFSKTLTNRIGALSDLAKPSDAGALTEITDAQIQELKAARPDLTEQQIRAALQ